MDNSEKISFDWQENKHRGKLINPTVHLKALLLEYISMPEHGLIQVKTEAGEMYVYCGSIHHGTTKSAFYRAMNFCFINNDPDDWQQYERDLLEKLYS